MTDNEIKIMMSACTLCPRKCGVNRYEKVGFCGCMAEIKAAKAMLHMWEEPPISLEKGSGAIFFSGCTLKCVYCQNKKISKENYGITLSAEKLAQVMILLQEQEAQNINLVTPTQYVPLIIQAIEIARRKNLNIPIIYNTGGYEEIDTINMLKDYVDIYLTDIKYHDEIYSKKYSNAKDYFKYAISSLKKMVEQKGENQFYSNGKMKSGVIVRHLVLPTLKKDSEKILNEINNNIDIKKIKLSLMSQYTPSFIEKGFEELDFKLTNYEYNYVLDIAEKIGYDGYMQFSDSAKEEYTPEFDLENLT